MDLIVSSDEDQAATQTNFHTTNPWARSRFFLFWRGFPRGAETGMKRGDVLIFGSSPYGTGKEHLCSGIKGTMRYGSVWHNPPARRCWAHGTLDALIHYWGRGLYHQGGAFCDHLGLLTAPNLVSQTPAWAEKFHWSEGRLGCKTLARWCLWRQEEFFQPLRDPLSASLFWTLGTVCSKFTLSVYLRLNRCDSWIIAKNPWARLWLCSQRGLSQPRSFDEIYHFFGIFSGILQGFSWIFCKICWLCETWLNFPFYSEFWMKFAFLSWFFDKVAAFVIFGKIFRFLQLVWQNVPVYRDFWTEFVVFSRSFGEVWRFFRVLWRN